MSRETFRTQIKLSYIYETFLIIAMNFRKNTASVPLNCRAQYVSGEL